MTGALPASPPAWARDLGPSGFAVFVELVRGYFADQGIPVDLDVSQGVARTARDGPLPNSAFGLRTLVQMCRQSDRDAWRDIIRAHFDTVFSVADTDSALRLDIADFEAIRDRLRARLYPEDILGQTDEIVGRPGPPGTLEAVVVDLPTCVRTISHREAALWPISAEALHAVARENLLAGGLLPVSSAEVERGVHLKVIQGDPYYAASHALWLDRYLAGSLPHGALVAIPRRDITLFHEVRSLSAIEAVTALLRIAIAMHRDGPGSLTPNVYWWRTGEFAPLPYELEEGTLRFSPPDDFLDLLDKLTRGAILS